MLERLEKNYLVYTLFIFLFVTLLSITGLTVYATEENNQFEINMVQLLK